MVDTVDENDVPVRKIVDTTVGRVLFNQVVPKEVGYLNSFWTTSRRSATGWHSKAACRSTSTR